MDKIATFLVKKRYLLLILTLLLAAGSVFLIPHVKKNGDMKKYLPEGSMTGTGLRIMESNFEAVESNGALEIMIRGADGEKERELIGRIHELPGLLSVTTSRGTDENGVECLRFTLTSNGTAASENAGKMYEGALGVFKNEKYDLAGDVYYKRIPILPPYVMILAVGIVSAVLIVMSDSFFAPLLFLAGILSAIAINLGTNLFFGEISVITDAIAAILQLALSMDYSIMLMARYRAERKQTPDKVEAMYRAVRSSFTSIVGSAQTTFAGLITLVFMSFTIGRDLGFVLAKGVLCSLLTVFCMLPALITVCDRLLLKTAKKAPVLKPDRLAALAYRGRAPLSVLFVLLFVFASVFQGGQKITYTGSELDHISEVFGKTNDFALIYKKEDEALLSPYLERIAEDRKTNAVLSIPFFDKKLAPGMFTQTLARAGITLPVGADLIKAALYLRAGKNADGYALTVRQFLAFLSEELRSGALEGLLTERAGGGEGADPFSSLAYLAFSADAQPRTASEMARYFEGTVLTPELVGGGFILYAALQDRDPEPASLRELSEYVRKDLPNDPVLGGLISEETRSALAQFDLTNAERMLSGGEYRRALLRTTLPTEGEETFAYISRILEILEPVSGRGVYLVSDSTFAYEMNADFTREYVVISILTMAAIFLIVALTFRSLAVPLILVAVIECAVFLTMTIMHFTGTTVYFLAIIILQSILMGATVDYAILFTSFYREHRRAHGKKEALRLSYRSSIGTIFTSSVILVIGTLIVGYTAIEIVSKICLSIAYGTICATVLILLFTPAMLALFDRFTAGKGRLDEKNEEQKGESL